MGQLQQQESEEPARVVGALPIPLDAMVKSSSDPMRFLGQMLLSAKY